MEQSGNDNIQTIEIFNIMQIPKLLQIKNLRETMKQKPQMITNFNDVFCHITFPKYVSFIG